MADGRPVRRNGGSGLQRLRQVVAPAGVAGQARLAAWTKPVNGVVRVNLVYTPPDRRGKGYASALVAAVSQAILDQGNVAILYADEANPASSKIYAAMGYEKVEQHDLWETLHLVPATAVTAANNLAARWANATGQESNTVFSAVSVWPLLALLGVLPAARRAKSCWRQPGMSKEEQQRPRTDAVLSEAVHARLTEVLIRPDLGIWSRDVRDGQLINHSDRGATYTSIKFSERLADNGILPSMGSVGDSYDNALMENFFGTLKLELVYRNAWRTRDEAENALFVYIDGWYNRQRIQKELGWFSPDEYEAAWYAKNFDEPDPVMIQAEPTPTR